jgi:hypothetical protein
MFFLSKMAIELKKTKERERERERESTHMKGFG